MTGQFLEKFFSDRGNYDVKPNGEADVCCPFPHGKDGHLEKNPSAHVNQARGVFHCKTCAAEGLFKNGGLSEIDFFAKVHNVSYEDAVRMLAEMFGKNKGVNLVTATEGLKAHAEYMDFLRNERGLTDETIEKYQLGFAGDNIDYPVIVYGEVLDVRSYNPNWKEEGTPKIKSQRGASALLFPFDHWLAEKNTVVTVICAGENDALILRQHGFNAITTTMGEGNFPKMFAGLFKGMDVYICYDCDKAGRTGAKKVAFQLMEKGASVKIIDLGLDGDNDKRNKDVSDYFLKNGKTASDFSQLMNEATPYTFEDVKEMKDLIYPLIDLWEIEKGEHTNQRRSSRVLNMGKIGAPMDTPTAVEWACVRSNAENPICKTCSRFNESGWWTLGEQNLDELLEIIECKTDIQKKNLLRFIGIPSKCPSGVRTTIRARQHVQKVVFAPDVDSENELSGYQQAEHLAYVIGSDKLEDGGRYRAFFKKFPHPIQGQEIVLVVDRLEASDNALNTFKMTPELVVELDSQFGGHPNDVMKKRFENVQKLVGKFAPEMVVHAVDLTYHSVLDFWYGGRMIKGHPEGLIIGDTRTGKSDVSKSMMSYYGIGNYTELKNGSLAGLLGGVEKMGNGAYRLKWGKIPRNHKGMIILDELSGLQEGVMSQLTGLRSEREARIEKIVSGVAPAKTRLLWISNPKGDSGSNFAIADYPNGIQVAEELIGKKEDLARFDFVILVQGSGTSDLISPLTKEKLDHTHNPAYRNLIYWIWTRTAEQVLFDTNIDQYIWTVSQELNETYESEVQIFGREAFKKVARLAISVAGCCFSHDGTGTSVLVKKEHVDWARQFLVKCYDNDIFRLPEYVEQEKSVRQTTPEINALVAQLVQQHPMVMKELHKSRGIPLRMLQATSGYDTKDFNKVFNVLVQKGLVITSKENILATLRLRKAFQAWMKDHEEYRIPTLMERGDSPL